MSLCVFFLSLSTYISIYRYIPIYLSIYQSRAIREPGGDYVKKLTVKNLTNDVLKVKYALPKTKFFFLEYPEVIVLSPGVVTTIPIRFRPNELLAYQDEVEFEVMTPNRQGSASSGRSATVSTFCVPVAALLPTCDFHIPDSVDFGLCTAAHPTNRSFLIQNTGEVPISYQFTLSQDAEQFRILPQAGNIRPGESANISATFESEVCAPVYWF
jgi:HYDIN/CFA65/VesB-like, Ig-like domain